MATLNLSKMKYMSETNLRRLVSILVGLMSSVSALEDQCIKEYDETKTYQKGQIVVGSDGYFYEAVTVTNGVFDSSKWTKIGTDNFEELDVDTIKGFLGLTPEQLETMADLISTEIRLDKVFSSSDTYTRIDNALKEAKEYCLTQLAKKSTGSFKKATSTAEVTDGNYLYLILNSVTSKYDIYALVDSNVELLTSVDVNLDNYFTKAEIEADYLKKADADGKYATITTVDGKVDKDKIVTALDGTVTDEQVPSAKVVYDNILTEEDVLAIVNKEGLKFIDDANDETLTNGKYATKTTTANLPVSAYGILIIEKYKDTNSTWVKQTYKPLADQLYVRSKINDLDYTDWQKITVVIEKSYGQAVTIEDELDLLTLDTNVTFSNNSNTGALVDLTGQKLFRIEHKVVISSKSYVQIAYDIATGKLIATRSKNWQNSTWSAWNLVCTTKVKDVDRTAVVITNTTNFPDGTGFYYEVKNGVCYVWVYSLKITNIVDGAKMELFDDLPKSASYVCQPLNAGSGVSVQTCPYPFNICMERLKTEVYIKSGNTNYTGPLFGSFSYPVAE